MNKDNFLIFHYLDDRKQSTYNKNILSQYYLSMFIFSSRSYEEFQIWINAFSKKKIETWRPKYFHKINNNSPFEKKIYWKNRF